MLKNYTVQKKVFFILLFIFLSISLIPKKTFAYTNLLTNPGAETGDMTGWTIDTNGGNGWSETFDGIAHSDTHSFATSFSMDTRHQTIDLVAAGYTPTQLDGGTFSANISEWIMTRADAFAGGSYYLNFELLASDGTTVLASHNFGSQGSPLFLGTGVNWFQQSYTFSNIPTGTRYIRFEDGGQSLDGWAGDYGPHFDDASVVLSDTPFYNLSYAPGSNGSLTGTITQTLSSGSNGTTVTAVPNNGYHFVDWSDASLSNPRTNTDVLGNISVTASFGLTIQGGQPLVSMIFPTGISLNESSKNLSVASTDQLTATIVPSTATNKNINWSSSSPSVATVNSSGLIKTIAPGSTTITATLGLLTAKDAVTVSAPIPVVTPTPVAQVVIAAPVTSIAPIASPLLQPSIAEPINTISTNLHIGMKSADVQTLQEFLISQNKGPRAAALAVSGATQNFGMLTKTALIEWQKAMGIVPAYGYFGPMTRAKIKSLNL